VIARYQALAQSIQDELTELEGVVAAVLRHWHGVQSAPADQDAYLNSVAFNLHSFYSGLERLFELIAIELDGGALGGAGWHSELLRQMTLDLRGTRPPVLHKETAVLLDDYRKFRHLVRHIYAAHLDPKRVELLVIGLPAVWRQLKEDLWNFTRFLQPLSHADEG
jgi:hypothetical protein